MHKVRLESVCCTVTKRAGRDRKTQNHGDPASQAGDPHTAKADLDTQRRLIFLRALSEIQCLLTLLASSTKSVELSQMSGRHGCISIRTRVALPR